MARDYQDDYNRGNEEGFFDRIGNKVHQAWDRLTGDEEDSGRGQQRRHSPYSGASNRSDHRSSPYGAGAADNYNSGTPYRESDRQSGRGYGESHLGRYSPQQAPGSRYGRGDAHRSEHTSSSGYSGRMSDYGSASQRGGAGSSQGQGARGSGYSSGSSPYGGSGSGYSNPQGNPYDNSAARNYGNSSGYSTPEGGYGRSSMGFPRGSDYGSGGSGSMGGGYFGSGGGPWSGGTYSNTGNSGYTPQRNPNDSSKSDYRYSRREQENRGKPDDNYGDYYNR